MERFVKSFKQWRRLSLLAASGRRAKQAGIEMKSVDVPDARASSTPGGVAEATAAFTGALCRQGSDCVLNLQWHRAYGKVRAANYPGSGFYARGYRAGRLPKNILVF
jgi:hypothetical protein